MKKVCKVNENDSKILILLKQNREGLRSKTLERLLDLKTRVLYKRLEILKKQGLVENIFPIWKITNGGVGKCAILSKSSDIFELHNLSFVIKLIDIPLWWNKRKNRLIKLKQWHFSNIYFGKGSSNPYQQLINDHFVIQTYPESIIIIARKRYYGDQPYEVIINALNDVLDLISWFEERFKFKFWKDGVPCLELRGNDFNRIKDFIAEKCKKEGHRFLVEVAQNKKVWVDYSEPFGKEANYPEGQEKLEKLTKDILLNKSLLPSEMTDILGKVIQNQSHITQNQVMFDKNFQSHLNILNKLGQAVDNLTAQVKLLSLKNE